MAIKIQTDTQNYNVSSSGDAFACIFVKLENYKLVKIQFMFCIFLFCKIQF